MSQSNAAGSALNHDLLKQAQAHLEKASWTPPGSVPAVSYNSGIGSAPRAVAAKPPVATQSGPKPQTSGSMAKDTLDSVLARGGGNGWKAPGTVPAVSYNMGLVTPAEPIAARPPVATQSGPKPAAPSFSAKKPVAQTRPAKPVDAKPAMLQSEQALHPSDQAKQILAQLNQRRRDAAFGRGSLSSSEDKAMEAQAKKLLGQSNTMRNAPGYKPDAKSMHPRDQADVVRQRLNNMRSSAGGEVAQSGKMLRQLDQLGAAADAMPVPARRPAVKSEMRPAAPAPRRAAPAPMFAKASAANMPFMFGAQVGKQAFFLPAVGGVTGGLLAPSGHRMEGLGRGVTQGVGGSVGSAIGAPVGMAGALALALINPRIGKALFGASSSQLGNIGKKVVNKWNGTGFRPLTQAQKIYASNLLSRGGTAGAIGGAYAGATSAGALMGKPSWESAK